MKKFGNCYFARNQLRRSEARERGGGEGVSCGGAGGGGWKGGRGKDGSLKEVEVVEKYSNSLG